MSDLEGKVAFVTGGASGIGLAAATMLAGKGMKVVVADINAAAADAALARIGAAGRFKQLDVSDPERWDEVVAETVAEFDALDVLVNCAGLLLAGTIEDISLQTWHKTMAVNVDGVYFGCRAAVRAMRRNPTGGSIINLSSTSALRADPDLIAYDASKAAVRSMTKEIAVYCARQGYHIRCNSIHPGTIATPMLDQFFDDEKIRESHYDSWMNSTPIGRPGAPADVASLICFLASSRSSFMTGADCVIDGGVTA